MSELLLIWNVSYEQSEEPLFLALNEQMIKYQSVSAAWEERVLNLFSVLRSSEVLFFSFWRYSREMLELDFLSSFIWSTIGKRLVSFTCVRRHVSAPFDPPSRLNPFTQNLFVWQRFTSDCPRVSPSHAENRWELLRIAENQMLWIFLVGVERWERNETYVIYISININIYNPCREDLGYCIIMQTFVPFPPIFCFLLYSSLQRGNNHLLLVVLSIRGDLVRLKTKRHEASIFF